MQTGNYVVYRKTKHSRHPGPRARDIHPAEHGEDYNYTVDKYWVVVDIGGDNIICKTRTGKEVNVHIGDPNLRKAHILERIFKHHRFPYTE